jgi:hypothetical protein
MRVQPFADVRVGRTGGWIERAHAPIADGRDQHREQSDQNDGDEVTVRELLRHTIKWHRRNRLNEDNPIED